MDPNAKGALEEQTDLMKGERRFEKAMPEPSR